MRALILLMIAMDLAAQTATAATLTVRPDGSGDFSTIQPALDAAATGDTVLIGPGLYTETAARPSAWFGGTILTHAFVPVAELTIIGAGADQTIVGPASQPGNCLDFEPQGFTCEQGGILRLAGLTVRNCACDVRVVGTLFMDRCAVVNGSFGVAWEAMGTGGWIRDSQFTLAAPSPCEGPTGPIVFALLDVRSTAGAAGILVENCAFDHAAAGTNNIDGITFRHCDFTGGPNALELHSASNVEVDDCRLTGLAETAVLALAHPTAAGSACRIRNSTLEGGVHALDQQAGCRFDVATTRLVGGSGAVVQAAAGSGACVVRACDLVRGTGPLVQCGVGGSAIQHDFRDNYWGTADAAEIAASITDHVDDPGIGATVTYSPFSGESVPATMKTWGDVKALYR